MITFFLCVGAFCAGASIVNSGWNSQYQLLAGRTISYLKEKDLYIERHKKALEDAKEKHAAEMLRATIGMNRLQRAAPEAYSMFFERQSP